MSKRGKRKKGVPVPAPEQEFRCDPFASVDLPSPPPETEPPPSAASAGGQASPLPAPSSIRDSHAAGLPVAESFPWQSETRPRLTVRLEKKGRRGKAVTVFDGFDPDAIVQTMELLAELKQALGLGGRFVDGALELQGDQRSRAAGWLEQRGYIIRGAR